MGERVHVRTTRAEPVDESAGDAPYARTVDYAKPDVNPKFPTFWRAFASVRALIAELHRAIQPWAEQVWHRLGGARQIFFAIGLAFVLGGLGAALSRYDGPSETMAIGGLIIGLTYRLPNASNR